jgi:hypothetical protein
MPARTMGTTPTKALAAAREKLARLERTIETELPQELSKLAEAGGCFDVSAGPKKVTSAAHGGGRKKAGRTKKATAVPETRQQAGITTTAFLDDGHPTILADPRGWIHRS